MASSGPKEEKKQEIVQELPPNTDLSRRNQELENRLRDVTVESENLKIQVQAMTRQVADLQVQAQRVEGEKDQAYRQHEGKTGAQSQWEEKCKALEAEVAKLKEDLSNAKASAKPKNNFAVDDI